MATQKPEVTQQSQEGSGPAIVSVEAIKRLERLKAPEHLLKAARKAQKTNPH
ncbi:MAG TPA: hypothetical protein VJ989_07290 [Solirubrobacterales bacterium]|nr:hypothetical protein [Solirubrobacterales bacterium]